MAHLRLAAALLAATGVGLTMWGTGRAAAPKADPAPAAKADPKPAPAAPPTAQWIWFAEGNPRGSAPAGAIHLRTVMELPAAATKATVSATADNGFELYLDGVKVLDGDEWKDLRSADLTGKLAAGRHVLAVKAVNESAGPAGFVLMLTATLADGKVVHFRSDAGWKAARTAPDGWEKPGFDDSAWKAALELGAYGTTPPWGAASAGPVAKGKAGTPKTIKPTDIKGRFTVPEGFTVERVADHTVTGSIVRFQFDHKGRPMLSRERGPLVVLEDFADGTYKKATVLSDKVKNCQGLFDHLGTIYCVGDGPQGTGLYRLTGEPGAMEATLLRKTKGGMGEHGPHQVTVGPDGRLWWCLGNHSWAPPYAANSGVRDWYEGHVIPSWNDSRGHAANIRAPGGTILRSNAAAGAVDAATGWSLETMGFRNQYAFAFDGRGEVFSWDSDMEWDVGLPWYRPVRVNHCVSGADFGWRTGAGKWPDHHADSLGTVVDIGRGSPCGMMFYRHREYPAKYHGALFITDWSLGRILAVFTTPDGAGYTGRFEDFVTGRPLNVSDVDVGQDGYLYFATGGRNTEGGLFRVKSTRTEPRAEPGYADATAYALHLPQPQSAWAIATAAGAAKQAGNATATLKAKVLEAAAPAEFRLRALHLLGYLTPAELDEALATKLAHDHDPVMKSRGLRMLGDFDTAGSHHTLLAATADNDPLVKRAALEGLLHHKPVRDEAINPPPVKWIMPLAGHADRTVRYLAHVALKRLPREAVLEALRGTTDARTAAMSAITVAAAHRKAEDVPALLGKLFEVLTAGPAPLADDVLLDLVRAVQVVVAVHDGGLDALNAEARPGADKPLPGAAGELGARLLALFPHRDRRVNAEVARLCSRLSTPGVQAKVLDAIRRGATREQQIHYVWCLRAAKEGWDDKTRAAMFGWFVDAQAWTGGNSFAGHIDIAFNEWLRTVPASEADTLRKERVARKPKEPERLPVKPAASKYGFDELLAGLTTRKGDAAKGQELVKKANCMACHRWGTTGEGAGPDLTDVGRRFQRKDLLESLIYPSKVISDQYKGRVWRMADETVVTGVIATQDDATITVIQPDTKKVVLKKADIADTREAKVSIMPEGLLNPFTPEEIADLFAALEAGPANR